MVGRGIGEPLHKVGMGLSPPTHKPKVSFKAKVDKLARSKGRSIAPSKLLPPRSRINPSSTTVDLPPAPNKPPHQCTQTISDPPRDSSKLFTSKSFSHHIQSLRQRQTKEGQQHFHERYGGIIVEHARRDLTELMAEHTSKRSPDASKGAQPTRKCGARRNGGRKRLTKARAEAEEVMKICRSTKSYIVDMATFRRRGPPTLPASQNPPPAIASSPSRSSPVRAVKAMPEVRSQRGSEIGTTVPELPPQLLSTSLQGVPRGLNFTRKRKLAPEPKEVSGHQDPLTTGVSKRRQEDSERNTDPPAPRKKPRLGWQ